MTITNMLNLPAGLVRAVSPKMHNAPGSLSATTLLKGVKEIILTERHWGEMTADASDRIWAVFGTAVHALLEQEGADDFAEVSLETAVDGVRVTGRIDNYNMKEGVVTDYKTASTWKVRLGEFEDWRRQGLIYAWLLWRNGFPIKKCRFVALLKDHSKTEAARHPDYPQCPIFMYEFDVTREALKEAGELAQKKVAQYLLLGAWPDDQIPACSAEERWASPDKWAVMKKGRKSAVRVLDSKEEAEKMAMDDKALYVEYRKGESRKCAGYCACREFCSFYREMRAEQESVQETGNLKEEI